jgi:hypothetical protein
MDKSEFHENAQEDALHFATQKKPRLMPIGQLAGHNNYLPGFSISSSTQGVLSSTFSS